MFRWHLGMYKSVDRLKVSNCKSFDAKFWTVTSQRITKAIQLSRRWSREAEDGFASGQVEQPFNNAESFQNGNGICLEKRNMLPFLIPLDCELFDGHGGAYQH